MHLFYAIKKKCVLLSSSARVHGTHGADGEGRGINQGIGTALFLGGGRNGAAQLSFYGLCAELYNLVKDIGSRPVFLIGIKSRRVRFHQRVNEISCPVVKGFKTVSVDIFFYQLV